MDFSSWSMVSHMLRWLLQDCLTVVPKTTPRRLKGSRHVPLGICGLQSLSTYWPFVLRLRGPPSTLKSTSPSTFLCFERRPSCLFTCSRKQFHLYILKRVPWSWFRAVWLSLCLGAELTQRQQHHQSLPQHGLQLSRYSWHFQAAQLISAPSRQLTAAGRERERQAF